MTLCAADCGAPEVNANVNLDFNSTTEGSVVVFQCSEGLKPTAPVTGGCGVWFPNPAQHTCTDMSGGEVFMKHLAEQQTFMTTRFFPIADCGSPIPPVGGSINNYTSTVVEAEVTFQCDEGLEPILDQ